MGTDDLVEKFEDLLGINDENAQSGNPDEKGTGEAEHEDKGNVAPTPNTQPATVITTEEQDDVLKDILKIDIEIEKLETQAVDITTFYDNLEEELTEQEQELEFSDKPAYMKLVAQKAKEYEEKNSPSTAIENLKTAKEELTQTRARQVALSSVVNKYPDFSYEKVFEFFDKKLNKEQQQAIYDESASYQDVYEKAYLSYAKSNKTNIEQEEPPMIPDVNNVRKQSVDHHTIDDGLTSDEQRMRDALGL